MKVRFKVASDLLGVLACIAEGFALPSRGYRKRLIAGLSSAAPAARLAIH